MSDNTKTILFRFLRGGIASAVSAMVVIVPVGITNFHDLQPWLISLALAGSIGLISGLIQAVDKYLRWTPNQ